MKIKIVADFQTDNLTEEERESLIYLFRIESLPGNGHTITFSHTINIEDADLISDRVCALLKLLTKADKVNLTRDTLYESIRVLKLLTLRLEQLGGRLY